MEYKYARRMSSVTASEIRELLKLTEQPEVISFAGGLPAPELFPIEEIKAVNDYVSGPQWRTCLAVYHHGGIPASQGMDRKEDEYPAWHFL